jgi:hypothetical protein
MRCVSDDLSLLMALRTQGLATAERVATAVASDAATAAAGLGELMGAELVKQREGRHTGFMLLPAGAAKLGELLAQEGLRTSASLCECYDRFMQLNTRVLKVCSQWQLRSDGGTEVPNDHSDPDYDASVIDRLSELHARASSCIGKIAACAERYGPYGVRLDSCLERLHAGDRTAFTAPMAESYHTVWFELHQDLLLTLGRERED